MRPLRLPGLGPESAQLCLRIDDWPLRNLGQALLQKSSTTHDLKDANHVAVINVPLLA